MKLLYRLPIKISRFCCMYTINMYLPTSIMYFREFMIVLYVMSNGTPEENLKQIFRVFDINNDGSLSPRELRRLVHDLFQMFPQEDNPDKASQKLLATQAFKEMDTNADGRVSQEEFIRACLSHETISKMLALKVIDVFVGNE